MYSHFQFYLYWNWNVTTKVTVEQLITLTVLIKQVTFHQMQPLRDTSIAAPVFHDQLDFGHKICQ